MKHFHSYPNPSSTTSGFVHGGRFTVRTQGPTCWIHLLSVSFRLLQGTCTPSAWYSHGWQLETQLPSKLAEADTASKRAVRARGNTGPTEASRGNAGPTALHIHITLDQKAALHKPCHWQRPRQLLDTAKFHFVALPFVRVLFDWRFCFSS